MTANILYVVLETAPFSPGTSENSYHHLPRRFLMRDFVNQCECLLSILYLVRYSAVELPKPHNCSQVPSKEYDK
jgi:hypothetical protein